MTSFLLVDAEVLKGGFYLTVFLYYFIFKKCLVGSLALAINSLWWVRPLWDENHVRWMEMPGCSVHFNTVPSPLSDQAGKAIHTCNETQRLTWRCAPSCQSHNSTHERIIVHMGRWLRLETGKLTVLARWSELIVWHSSMQQTFMHLAHISLPA